MLGLSSARRFTSRNKAPTFSSMASMSGAICESSCIHAPRRSSSCLLRSSLLWRLFESLASSRSMPTATFKSWKAVNGTPCSSTKRGSRQMRSNPESGTLKQHSLWAYSPISPRHKKPSSSLSYFWKTPRCCSIYISVAALRAKRFTHSVNDRSTASTVALRTLAALFARKSRVAIRVSTSFNASFSATLSAFSNVERLLMMRSMHDS
mmetsp:Transcript_61235/g.178970  ORF Transcript_61235/g.178970 Transcript_61235/m.178970 type:complete len:208 (-) Transcript_61235:316-939(-)